MSTNTLPTSRMFITSLIDKLSTADAAIINHDQDTVVIQNPLKNAPPQIKSTLLTLHVLFPNELLPALDVLDRNLVTRLQLKDFFPHSLPQRIETYFVRSAQQSSSSYHHRSQRHEGRFHNAMGASSYEVKLDAWNCSCPAFAFSAFPAEMEDDGSTHDEAARIVELAEECSKGWKFGELTLESSPAGIAVCKHLLACVLVERCPALFGGSVEVREVDREEFAGWCAGWGG